MLSEKKIRKMIRLSDYESGLGGTDLKRIRYKKTDYIRLQMLKTAVAVILAGVFIVALLCLIHLDYILVHLFEIPFHKMAIIGGSGILTVEMFSLLITIKMAKRQYEDSSLRAKEYENTLRELLELYEEEEGQEENVL